MANNNNLKILFIDIETAPSLGYVWGKYEQNVIQFQKEWYILCFTAKWQGSNKLITKSLNEYPAYLKDKEDDSQLLKDIWNLLDEADIVVAHNGDKFDIKKINSRFIINGFSPPSPYKTIDTLKIARKHFGFDSNRLNDLGESLKLGTKLSTGGFKLWLSCMDGDTAAWSKMKAYNRQDVSLLEKVYNKLKPWMSNHPHIGVNKGLDCCNTCGSTSIQKRGFSYSRQSRYQRLYCSDCKSWSQGKLEKLQNEQSKK